MDASSTWAAVEAVLDQDRLSNLTGWPVRAVRLRIKPDVSLTVGLEDAATGRPAGWARLLWPISRAKAERAARRARERGLRTVRRELDGGLVLHAGRLASDPALMEHVGRAVAGGLIADPDGQRVLRHNPLRRLVVRTGAGVVRITSAPQDDELRLRDFIGARVPGAPIPAAAPGFAAPGPPTHISALRFVGDADLERAALPGTSAVAAASAAAGAALAALHASARHLPADLAARLPGRRADGRRAGAVHASVLRALDPALAARVRALDERLPAAPPAPRVLSHGDFTPDQVLVRRADGAVWITDFERSRLAPAATDLGSYLAVVDDATGRALLDGYADAGGRVPDEADLAAGVLGARLERLAEPLRHADPRWRERIGRELEELEETCATR
ncbi:aminoglycoside phosphotransferase family protein [uncultured Actinomyces sp.]|uniref:phosphotransferase family protein n=1 Tax=uncultured Actinomyces sp. TaxID=249061 RepID=UPI00288AA4EB|nr:aminoglycoside phosphotransferase family protein [uncultured Actinomyces sp.]